jgi:hypothetical protein
MNLIFDDRIRKKYFSPTPSEFFRNNDDIKEIVIHGTGGGQSAEAIINWMLGGERESLYRRGIGMFHYEIDLDGDIYCLLPNDIWCYHSDAGLHDKQTIGIELLNTGVLNSAEYTEAQYKALDELIVKLCKQFPSIDSIVSHDANRKKFSKLLPKPCPGIQFDWTKVEETVTYKLNQTITIMRG